MARILVVDGDFGFRIVMWQALEVAGYQVLRASTAREGAELLTVQPVDAAIVGAAFFQSDGLRALAELREARPTLPVIVAADRDAAELAAQLGVAPVHGPVSVLGSPYGHGDLLAAVAIALER